MSDSGRLTHAEFVAECKALATQEGAISGTANGGGHRRGWEWVELQGRRGTTGYLRLEDIVTPYRGDNSSNGDGSLDTRTLGAACRELEEEEDPASATSKCEDRENRGWVSRSYHVVYSTTYQVPVLMFTAGWLGETGLLHHRCCSSTRTAMVTHGL